MASRLGGLRYQDTGEGKRGCELVRGTSSAAEIRRGLRQCTSARTSAR
jgi:hypothetical protein